MLKLGNSTSYGSGKMTEEVKLLSTNQAMLEGWYGYLHAFGNTHIFLKML